MTEIHRSVLNVSEKIQHSNTHRIKLYYNFNYPPQVATEAMMNTRIDAIRIGAEKLHTAYYAPSSLLCYTIQYKYLHIEHYRIGQDLKESKKRYSDPVTGPVWPRGWVEV